MNDDLIEMMQANTEHIGPKRDVFLRVTVPAEVTDLDVRGVIDDALIDAYLTDPYTTVWEQGDAFK